jgi:hypothetical protein
MTEDGSCSARELTEAGVARDTYGPICRIDTPRERTSDLFNSGQELGDLQPLSF